VVVVNLYPFYDKVTSGNISFEDGIENIDIGGPTMIRAADKVDGTYLDSKRLDAVRTYFMYSHDHSAFNISTT